MTDCTGFRWSRNPNCTPVCVCVSHGDSPGTPEAGVSADGRLGCLGRASPRGSQAKPPGAGPGQPERPCSGFGLREPPGRASLPSHSSPEVDQTPSPNQSPGPVGGTGEGHPPHRMQAERWHGAGGGSVEVMFYQVEMTTGCSQFVFNTADQLGTGASTVMPGQGEEAGGWAGSRAPGSDPGGGQGCWAQRLSRRGGHLGTPLAKGRGPARPLPASASVQLQGGSPNRRRTDPAPRLAGPVPAV